MSDLPVCVMLDSGASITAEKLFPSGMYLVELCEPSGSLFKKKRVDTKQGLKGTLKEFRTIAEDTWGGGK